MSSEFGFNLDALVPGMMAEKAESSGVAKVSLGPFRMFALAVLAGAFVALGAVFATTVTTGASGEMPYGIIKLVGGLAFCLGLILVIGAGAELFTGNNLIVMAWAHRKVTTRQLLRNWSIVYVGNFCRRDVNGRWYAPYQAIHLQQRRDWIKCAQYRQWQGATGFYAGDYARRVL